MKSRERDSDWSFFFATVILILLLDIASKYLVSAGLWTGEYLGGLLRITHVSNPGAAFGLFPGARPAFIVIKIVAMLIILGIQGRRNLSGPPLTIPLAFIFSGALGNLLDRLRGSGEVVDFLDFGFGARRWYVFNVADTCITIGALLLILALMRRPNPEPETISDGI